MKWPRGKFNGQRIVGIYVLAKLNILDWGFQFGGDGLCHRIGPMRLWLSWEYE